MPQKLPVGKSVKNGPNIILQRPELAALFANIITNWTLVESNMLRLYGMLLGDGLPTPKAPEGYFLAPPVHPSARQIFQQVQGLEPRLKLISGLCEWRMTETDANHFTSVIMPSIRKRAKERNRVAHNEWGICDDYPDAIILAELFGEMQIWKSRDLQGVSERILDLNKDLGAFVQKAYHERYLRLNPHAKS